ncbi:MAG: septum site-determining protein MinC [Pseudomonadota bacterium]
MVNASAPLHDATPAFQLKGGSFTGTVLELHSTDLTLVAAHLAARLQDAAAWLRESPVILNLDKVAGSDADWAGLVALCRANGVSLVGIRAPQALQASLQALDVPVLQGLKRKGAEVEVAAAPAPAPAAAPAPVTPRAATRIITQPVRGGQQIYAEGDLIVLAPVSAGAEVLADGNIHIYAPLRGRALAGVQGNIDARVFCQLLEAELVSVAGRYRVAEDLRKTKQWGKTVQVVLDQDQLNLLDL